jgi:hypothetical protein
MSLNNKQGFEFSFGWIFALLFGAVIIFLAVYMAFNIVAGERRASDVGLTKSFDTLLYPVGTGLESNKVTQITFPVETRLMFQCNSNGDFGEQIIKTSASSSLGNKYSQNPINVKSKDKYIFAGSSIEGKDFLTFVQPLNLPFDVADLVYFISAKQKYCFIVSKTSSVGKELDNLKKNNYYFNKSVFIGDLNDCPADSNKVCFNSGAGSNCNISISGNQVIKGNKIVYFDGGEIGNSLLYAAVFSESDYYECQVKRLNKRASELAKLYIEKQKMSPAGCGLGLGAALETYANLTKNFNNTKNSLGDVVSLAKEIRRQNEELSCPLF